MKNSTLGTLRDLVDRIDAGEHVVWKRFDSARDKGAVELLRELARLQSQRHKRGIKKAKAEGRVGGGSVKGRRLSVTEDQIGLIRRLAKQGVAKAKIARDVGVSRNTVYRALE